MEDDFTYFAISVIPNYFLTGIIAVIVSSGFIIWAAKFVEKKYGVIVK